jgi:hypothetical protein
VTWSIQEGAAGGTITPAGVYTAPATAGTYHVVATSQANPAVSMVTPVTVNATTVGITITPLAGPFYASKTYQFAAPVTGSSNQGVTWASTDGTITAAGLYTPAALGAFKITATSQADPTKSATFSGTVTVPNPTFSSVPSTTLAQATATYTYGPITAVDPAGTAITYTLTTGPGTITGNTLSWTTLANFSDRVTPTTFTVTAKTAAGGVATQSWTVTPLRPVSMTIIDKFWGASGEVDNPLYDTVTGTTTTPGIPNAGVIVPGSSTTCTSTTGVTLTLCAVDNGDGTYTINNVPAGNYWLVAGPAEHYWTNTNTFDIGTDYVGQKLEGNATAMTLDIGSVGPPATGLTIDAFSAGDAIWIGSADANSWYAPPAQTALAPGATLFTDVTDTIPLSTLPALTVDSYILQFDWSGTTGTGSTAGLYQGLSIQADQAEATGFNYTTAPASTPLAPSVPTTLALSMSGWKTLIVPGEPVPASGQTSSGDPTTFFGTYLMAQPYTSPLTSIAAIGGGMPSCGTVACPAGYSGWPAGGGPEPATLVNTPHDQRQNGNPGPLYMAWAERCQSSGSSGDHCQGAVNGDTVQLSFSNPFPSAWPYVLWSQQEISVPITGATQLFTTYSNSAVEFSSIPTSATVQPVIEPVTSPAINGAFYSDAQLTAPLNISWTAATIPSGAPTGSKVAGYRVVVYAVPTTATPYWDSALAELFTQSTSVTVPTGLLKAGTYVFVIESIADARANVTTTPFRSSYPKGTAQIVSAAMTIPGGS